MKSDYLKIAGWVLIIGIVIVMLYMISRLQETPPIETPPITTETPTFYPCNSSREKCS
jgi:hypothetical protein